MYKNLLAEMVRFGISKRKMAESLGIGFVTISTKLKGEYEFTLKEARAIREIFFPQFSYEYLFAYEEAENS
jgi:DNA-binding XRE family transcriptional regulator